MVFNVFVDTEYVGTIHGEYHGTAVRSSLLNLNLTCADMVEVQWMSEGTRRGMLYYACHIYSDGTMSYDWRIRTL